MIRIKTAGTVGVRLNGRTVPKTYTDEPFELDEKAEASLVERGLAEYVSEEQEQAPKSLEEMEKKELYELALEKGLNVGGYKRTSAPKLRAVLKSLDETAADGQTGDESGESSENEQTAVTGDDSGQSGENAENGADTGSENPEKGSDEDQNGELEAGKGGSVSDEDADKPPVISAEGVVE